MPGNEDKWPQVMSVNQNEALVAVLKVFCLLMISHLLLLIKMMYSQYEEALFLFDPLVL